MFQRAKTALLIAQERDKARQAFRNSWNIDETLVLPWFFYEFTRFQLQLVLSKPYEPIT
jgi:hypothetical protein